MQFYNSLYKSKSNAVPWRILFVLSTIKGSEYVLYILLRNTNAFVGKRDNHLSVLKKDLY